MDTKTAVYTRVSTNDQEKGLASQQAAIDTYLAGHGLTAKRYSDRMTGATTARPGLAELQKAVFMGQVKTVVVWKLDRLSRSLRGGINLLTDWMEQGVRVVAVAQQIDLYGPGGNMVMAVLFAVAEMERENLRENTKRGMAKAKAAGVKLGRPQGLHGEQITPLLATGQSIKAIAKHLGVTKPALYACMKRENINPDDWRPRKVEHAH